MEAHRTTVTVESKDGTKLVAQRWLPPAGEVRGRVLIVHGYADHAERYRELALVLAPRGLEVTAIDLRGHGASPGRRGHVERFSHYHDDVEAALATVPTDRPRFLLGHSMGGLICLGFVATRAPKIDGLVVTNPYLALAMDPGPLKLVVGRIAARLAPTLAVPSGIPATGVSHDRAICEAYERDPKVFKTATAGWFREIQDEQVRVRALSALEVPLLYVWSDADPIVSSAANRELSATLTSPDKTVIERPGEFHEVLNETDRAELHARVGDWLLAHAR